MITDEVKAKLRETLTRYPVKQSAMLPCLHIVQEAEGYVTREGILAVAETIGVKPDEVESVVTFYSMYTQEPLGQNVVKICTSIACYLRGCDDILVHLESRLDIRRGETTQDGLFTLQGVECLAACGMAPAMQVNGRFFENATVASADELIDYLAQGNDAAGIESRWIQVADGAGMATCTSLATRPQTGGAKTPEEEAK